MKSVGIIRRVDDLGRIVIPKEVRKAYEINNGDPIEIFTNGDMIVFKKFSSVCIFCDSKDNLELFKDKSICPECFKDFKNNM